MSDLDSRTAVRLSGALTRFRVMAFITGSFLLLLCVEMFFKYVLGNSLFGGWVARVHGWIYVVYLVTVIDLWSAMKAGWTKLVTMVLAGVVPVMSFVEERRTVHYVREIENKLSNESTSTGV